MSRSPAWTAPRQKPSPPPPGTREEAIQLLISFADTGHLLHELALASGRDIAAQLPGVVVPVSVIAGAFVDYICRTHDLSLLDTLATKFPKRLPDVERLSELLHALAGLKELDRGPPRSPPLRHPAALGFAGGSEHTPMYLLVLLMVFILGLVGVLLFKRDSPEPSERRPSGGVKTLGPGDPGEAAAAAEPREPVLSFEYESDDTGSAESGTFVVRNLDAPGRICVFDAEKNEERPIPIPAEGAAAPRRVPTKVEAGWYYAPIRADQSCDKVLLTRCRTWASFGVEEYCLQIPNQKEASRG